jgi:hypothetical protein
MKRIYNASVTSFVFLMMLLIPQGLSAHCDSYDGPLVKDALKALETGKVDLVYKWIEPESEQEIADLFNKTFALKEGDKEIYSIVEKHFLETLVRLHRQGEGASFTGLKPAGSTSQIIVMADAALVNNNLEDLSKKLSSHILSVLNEKFQEAALRSTTKDNSVSEGRAYVKAYIAYTHFIEEIHGLLENKEEDHTSHAD